MITANCRTVTVTRLSFFFFFNDTATTEIYTLSLHDALPISVDDARGELLPNTNVIVTVTTAQRFNALSIPREALHTDGGDFVDRKSTRLNSSHANISYAVFCLKKKIQPLPLLYHITHRAQ